jgi:hypothetical protein
MMIFFMGIPCFDICKVRRPVVRSIRLTIGWSGFHP